jgi:hypothetical protein
MLYDALAELDKPVNKYPINKKNKINGGSRQKKTNKRTNIINTEKEYRTLQTNTRRYNLKKLLTTYIDNIKKTKQTKQTKKTKQTKQTKQTKKTKKPKKTI